MAWGYSSANKFGELFNLKRGNVGHYETGNVNPDLDFLFMLEKMSSFSIRELFKTDINRFDIPNRPLKNGEGLSVLNDKSLNVLNEPTTPYDKSVNNETIIVQRKLIAMLEARIKDLETQLEKLKTL